MAPELLRHSVDHSGYSDMSSTSFQVQVNEERLRKRRGPTRKRRMGGPNRARRQDYAEPLNAAIDLAAVTTATPSNSRTPSQSSSVERSVTPSTTAQSEGHTPTSLPTSIPSSMSSSVSLDGSEYSQSHSLLGWQIGLTAAFAVVIFILLPWFILRQLRRTRFRHEQGNVDLLANDSRSGGASRRAARTLVDFLSFGSIQDNTYADRSYFSGTASLSDPPPAYYLHPTNRRVSAAPSYTSRSESLQPSVSDRRRTRVPSTRLPMLGFVLPEEDERAPPDPEFDRELKRPDTFDGVDAGTSATRSPSTGGRTEKR